MKICNTELMKQLKVLEDEKMDLLQFEGRNCNISYSLAEKENTKFNPYDLVGVNARIKEIDAQVRDYKFALNKANVETIVDGFNMSIGSAIVYMSQLTNQIRRFDRLSKTESVTRRGASYGSTSPEYTELLYDPKVAKEMYLEAKNELMRLQIALDRTNLTNMIEV